MEWFTLLLVGVVYTISTYLTYSEDIRQKWYFIPLAVLLGSLTSVLWFCTVRYINDKDRIYVYSLFWDFVMIAIFYLYPVLFLGVKLDKWSLLGLFLVLVGIVIIKIRS